MEEYVSLQAVLDIASQYCPDDDGSCSKADVDPREMLDEIEALPTADVQPVKWISVNDRLPENTKPCVVVTEDNGLGASRYMGRNRFEWTLFGERVLYWLPIPEPQKDGETNG